MVYNGQTDSAEEGDAPSCRRTTGDLQRSWIWAGARIALGLGLLAAAIGFRMSQVSPAEPPPDRGSGVRAFAEPSADSAVSPGGAESVAENSAALGADPAAPESGLLGRVQGRLLGPAKERDAADQMVSCRLRGGTRFMTAADCAARGGSATLFQPRPDEAS